MITFHSHYGMEGGCSYLGLTSKFHLYTSHVYFKYSPTTKEVSFLIEGLYSKEAFKIIQKFFFEVGIMAIPPHAYGSPKNKQGLAL
jgi:hypothetical protein